MFFIIPGNMGKIFIKTFFYGRQYFETLCSARTTIIIHLTVSAGLYPNIAVTKKEKGVQCGNEMLVIELHRF